MSDNQAAVETPAVEAADPQAGKPEPQKETAGNGSEPFSLEKAKELRSENENLRRRLKALEKAEKDRADSELSELQKATQQREELQTSLSKAQDELRELRAIDLLRSAGGKHPELLVRHLTDEALQDRDVAAKEIKALQQKYGRDMFNIGSADGAEGRDSQPATTMGGALTAAIRRKVPTR